jgi:sodium/potassium-transporting ATPase subunit alpha
MKGAPERILSRCTKILIHGEERPFEGEIQELVNIANDGFGKLGERVLAFAKYTLEPEIYCSDS